MSPPQAVVVTGASSGIGAATVARLAADGYVVFAGVRSAGAAARVEGHPSVRALRFDVRDEDAVAQACSVVAASGLPLRGVVSNAGIAIAGPLEHVTLADVRRQFDVNVVGALGVVQAFLPLLRIARGRAVFVGSISGRLPVPYIAPYSASKAALRAVASALRVELAPAGVGVVLVEPGSVKTAIWEKGRDAADELRTRMQPAGTWSYGSILEALSLQTQREESTGMPAERVAAVIARSLTAKHPAAEILIGAPARLGSFVALLPARARERLMLRSMRLPTHD